MAKRTEQATEKRVPCPDCGELFRPRGLASHRRHRHGDGIAALMRTERALATEVEPTPDAVPAALPAAPIRADADRRAAEESPPVPELVQMLSALYSGLRGIDERLERLESLLCAGPAAPAAEREAAPPGEVETLEHDLKRVLSDIGRAKQALAECQPEDLGGSADAQRKRELHSTLGTLRRMQFSILFRMGSDAPGVTFDDDGLVSNLF